MRFQLLLLVITLFILSSCEKNEALLPTTDDYRPASKYKSNDDRGYDEFIFVSHTYLNNPTDPTAVNCGIHNVDFTRYQMIMLGGDMMYSTSKYEENMQDLDYMFDLGHPHTLWAIGNHDYVDLPLVHQYTNRPTYYSFFNKGVTFLVLDTQVDGGNITGDQLDFVEATIDSLEETTHLIVLTHKLLWMYDHPYLQPMIPTVTNGPLGNCNYCTPPNNFNQDVYPLLLEAKEDKKVEVICVAGDLGLNQKTFECKTEEGIHLLANGLSASETCDGNYGLIFYHKPQEQKLCWKFRTLTELQN